jgi:hypothetical protein
MKGLTGKTRGRAAVLVLLVLLAVPSVFADDTEPQARIIPPIGCQEVIPPQDEPTFLEFIWLWISALAE